MLKTVREIEVTCDVCGRSDRIPARSKKEAVGKFLIYWWFRDREQDLCVHCRTAREMYRQSTRDAV